MRSSVQHDLPKEARDVQAVFHRTVLRPVETVDDLTSLLGRRRLAAHMRSPAIRADMALGILGILVIDIDNLKEINARFGHGAGDAAICHVAESLRAQGGPDDLVGRTGGDDFTLICRVADSAALLRHAHVIHVALCAELHWQGRPFQIEVSIGACLAPGGFVTGEHLIQRAEIALEVSKARGRGRIMLYTDDMGRAQRRRQHLRRDLGEALHTDQFEIYLQPQLSLATGAISGCEALLRWRHPARGLLAPAAFMATASEMGLMVELDKVAMTKALDALRALQAAGFDRMIMSINVSAHTLADPGYPDRLAQAVRSRGLPLDRICVEVLETTVLDGSGADVATAIHRLKTLGMRVALDDFGTGYAGIAHMSSLAVDAIKLDRSMIARLDHDARNRVIVRGLIRLCRQLRMSVVAEGVETDAQRAVLHRAGCPVIQGFGLARPMPPAALLDWLARDAAAPRSRARALTIAPARAERYQTGQSPHT